MEIKKFKSINKGALQSVFTIVIPEWGGLEVDCGYFESESGAHWINYASKEYTDKEGRKKSFNQVRWPKEVHDRLYTAIREKLKDFLSKPPIEATPLPNEEELPF